MVASRKRGRQEEEVPEQPDASAPPGIIEQLRNMWEFANLAQFIFMFGKAVKLDENLDIEVYGHAELDCMSEC